MRTFSWLWWPPLVFFMLLLTGCQPKASLDDSEQLLYDSTGLRLTINPAHVPVESLLRLRLSSEQSFAAMTGEISGVSMYMGRIPVRFEKLSEGEWQAEFLLGACTDPQMQWQLLLRLTAADGTEQLIRAGFQSSWR